MLLNKTVQETNETQEQRTRGRGQNMKDHLLLARGFVKWMEYICGIHEDTTRNLNLNYLYFQFLKMLIHLHLFCMS